MSARGGLVSVIIPTRNYGHLLGEALQSVVDQRYRPLEIVVVDDGSTDRTNELLAAFAPGDAGLVVVRLPGLGLAAARNAGLDAARGRNVMFLDADDLLLPGAIGRLVAAIEAAGADMVVGGWVDEDMRGIGGGAAAVYCRRPLSGATFANVILSRPVASAFLLRANAHRFDVAVRVSELLDFLLGYGTCRPAVAYADAVVTAIRSHGAPNRLSVVHDHFEPVHRLVIVKRWRRIYLASPDTTPAVRAALDVLTLELAREQCRRGGGIDDVVCEIDFGKMRALGLASASWWLHALAGPIGGMRLLPIYEAARRVALGVPSLGPRVGTVS